MLFELLIEWIRQGGLARSAQADEVAARYEEELIRELSGRTQATYYRMRTKRMDAAVACSHLSSSTAARRLMVQIVRTIQPKRTVEVGTAFGVAAVALCHAIAENGLEGLFDGVELEEWKASLANAAVRGGGLGDRASVHAGPIEDILPRILESSRRPVDLAFVDAVHAYENVMGYHRLLMPYLADGAIVIYDDVYWSRGMMRFWEELVEFDVVSDAICVDGQWGVVRYGAS